MVFYEEEDPDVTKRIAEDEQLIAVDVWRKGLCLECKEPWAGGPFCPDCLNAVMVSYDAA